MRFLIVVLAIFGYAFAEPISLGFRAEEIQFQERALEDTVNKSIECVRNLLNTGIPEHGLPSLNPLRLKDLSINFKDLGAEELITGLLDINDLLAEGITSWHTRSLAGKLGLIPPSYTLDAEFFVSRAGGYGEYNGSLRVLNRTDLFGKGRVDLDVLDLKINAHVKVKIDKGIKLDQFSLKIIIGKLPFKIVGLNNNATLSEIVSQRISEEVPAFLVNNPNWIDENISPHVIEIFNTASGEEGGLVGHIIDKCSPF